MSRHHRTLAALGGLVAAALLAAGCSASGAAASGAGSGATGSGATGQGVTGAGGDWPLRVPLATSVATAMHLFAAVPMGRLGQPLETFWQLLVRPVGSGGSGGSGWADRSALGVATNGGLILAPTGSGALAVGTRPANRLQFSALEVTADAARSWSALAPVGALADSVSALGSLDAPGTGVVTGSAGVAAARWAGVLALVSHDGGEEVLAVAPGGTSVTTLVTSSALAATPAGRACAISSLDAVAGSSAGPLVGGTCARPGRVGLFVRSGGVWARSALALPPGVSGETQVVAFFGSGSEVTAVVAVHGRTGVALLAYRGSGEGSWAVSPPLELGRTPHLVSLGEAGRDGVFVLWSGGGSGLHASVLGSPQSPWQSLPPAPAGTATLVEAGPGLAEALAVHGAKLDVYRLGGSGTWSDVQHLRVPIEFGSSG